MRWEGEKMISQGGGEGANIQRVVPFLGVRDMRASLQFYVNGLGFTLVKRWEPDGQIRWGWLERGGAALMLQEFWQDGSHEGAPEGVLGAGMCLYFICQDAIALYHELRGRGIDASTPFVGNGMWVTGITDPDGYRLYFESQTDAPEETVFARDE